jgi:hypothetical protein
MRCRTLSFEVRVPCFERMVGYSEVIHFTRESEGVLVVLHAVF